MKSKTLFVTLAILSLLASSASAQSPGGEPVLSCKMEATQLGFEIEAEGEARIGRLAGDQYIAFRVGAELKDGTVLTVAVQNRRGVADIGSMKVEMGVALFRLYSHAGPSPAFPTENLYKVMVRLGKEEILEGRFVRE